MVGLTEVVQYHTEHSGEIMGYELLPPPALNIWEFKLTQPQRQQQHDLKM